MTDLQKQIDDLFRERSLWEIYKKSPSVFETRFNRNLFVIAAFLLATFAAISYLGRGGQMPGLPNINLFDLISKWSEIGISYASTILGFLLAGFSVLFSLIRPHTAIALLRVEMNGMSALKFVLFTFVDVFVHYTAFLCWCFTLFVLGGRGGVLDTVHHWSARNIPVLAASAGYIVFVLWGIWLVLILLKLKSFIWNLYQVLLLVMIDALEEHAEKRVED